MINVFSGCDIIRLYDAYKNGEITRTEYLAYLDLGYNLSDQVYLSSNRSIEMVTISYLSVDSNYRWTIDSGQSMMSYIGPSNDLTNSGNMTNNGDILFLYNSGRIVNTGTITNTGNMTIKSI